MINLYKYFKLTYKNLFLKGLNSNFVSDYGDEYLNFVKTQSTTISPNDIFDSNFNHTGSDLLDESKLLGQGQTPLTDFIFNIDDYTYDTNGDGTNNSTNGRLFDLLLTPSQTIKLLIGKKVYEIDDIISFTTLSGLVKQIKFSFTNEEDFNYVLKNLTINNKNSYLTFSEVINSKTIVYKFNLFGRVNTASDYELETMFGIISNDINSLDNLTYYQDVEIPLLKANYEGLTNVFENNLQIIKLYKFLEYYQKGLLEKFKHYFIDKSFKLELKTYKSDIDFPNFVLNNDNYFDSSLSSNELGMIDSFMYCNYTNQYYSFQNINILNGVEQGILSGLFEYKELYVEKNNTEYNEKFNSEDDTNLKLTAYNEYMNSIKTVYNNGEESIWYLESLITYGRLIIPTINYYRDLTTINISDYDLIYSGYLNVDITRNTYLRDFNYNLSEQNVLGNIPVGYKGIIYDRNSIINLINDFKIYVTSLQSFTDKTIFKDNIFLTDVNYIHAVYKHSYDSLISEDSLMSTTLLNSKTINYTQDFSDILNYISPVFTYNKFVNLSEEIGERAFNFNFEIINGKSFFIGSDRIKQRALMYMLNVKDLYSETESYYSNWFNNFYIYLHSEINSTMSDWVVDSGVELDVNRDKVEQDIIISNIIKTYKTPQDLRTISKDKMLQFIRGLNNE